MTSRRDFIKQIGGIAAVAGVGTVAVAEAAGVIADDPKTLADHANAFIAALRADMPADADMVSVTIAVDRQKPVPSLHVYAQRRVYVEDCRLKDGGCLTTEALPDRVVRL